VLGPLAGPAECWGVKDHVVLYEDGGRYFQITVMFGPGAQASLRAEVRRSLDTFTARPLPVSDQPAAQCQAGQWTACPQAAWAYRVMSRARVFQLGNQGGHAILALGGKRSFALRATPARPPALGSCHDLAGVRVCQAGARLMWKARGLWLSIEPASSPYSSLRSTPGLPPAGALARLIRASQRTHQIVPSRGR
jgi:hypothetical protein